MVERSYLRDLVTAVEGHILALDREMKPNVSTVDRGKRIAALINHLELSKDRAKHFGLKEPLTARPAARTPKPAPRPAEADGT